MVLLGAFRGQFRFNGAKTTYIPQWARKPLAKKKTGRCFLVKVRGLSETQLSLGCHDHFAAKCHTLNFRLIYPKWRSGLNFRECPCCFYKTPIAQWLFSRCPNILAPNYFNFDHFSWIFWKHICKSNHINSYTLPFFRCFLLFFGADSQVPFTFMGFCGPLKYTLDFFPPPRITVANMKV